MMHFRSFVLFLLAPFQPTVPLGFFSLMALRNNNLWAFAAIKYKNLVANESSSKREAKTNSKWDFSHSVNLLYLELANNKLNRMWKNMQPWGYRRMAGIGWEHGTDTLWVSSLFPLPLGCVLQAWLTLGSAYPLAILRLLRGGVAAKQVKDTCISWIQDYLAHDYQDYCYKPWWKTGCSRGKVNPSVPGPELECSPRRTLALGLILH